MGPGPGGRGAGKKNTEGTPSILQLRNRGHGLGWKPGQEAAAEKGGKDVREEGRAEDTGEHSLWTWAALLRCCRLNLTCRSCRRCKPLSRLHTRSVAERGL
ncbi:unnamed protein product [Prorocentrum cordatum]|uniref:G-patch domain-containing protein n=1 Tax=Prorocentrum cordatum TaxID=2364126 RepID=A0ABN9WII9_9DINO|nr:unnamed protein product [Polarella glacialis]|eukprot:2266563-Pyramimonas_sp.AAC.2